MDEAFNIAENELSSMSIPSFPGEEDNSRGFVSKDKLLIRDADEETISPTSGIHNLIEDRVNNYQDLDLEEVVICRTAPNKFVCVDLTV